MMDLAVAVCAIAVLVALADIAVGFLRRLDAMLPLLRLPSRVAAVRSSVPVEVDGAACPAPIRKWT
jgi:hypothetical protein